MCNRSHWPVHQLWPPSGGKQRTELDVVLFHGLQLIAKDSRHAWRSTWTQRGHDNVCWPQEWLPVDLGEAGEAVRIFSVSYNAHVVTSPHHHISDIAHNLFQTLMNPRYEWHCPIVLIGHSFGGLVLKSLVVKLKRASSILNPTNSWCEATVQSAKVFLRNVTGVAFYAVPHAGSSNIPKYVNKLLRCNNRHHCGIMDNIQPRQRDMEALSVDFDNIVNENKINIYAFCEGRPVEDVGILVDYTSAQRLAGSNFYMVEDANHMEVCKPPSKEHPSYSLLLQFIINCGKASFSDLSMAEECRGLPLALKVIGRAMFGKTSCELQWKPPLKKLRESRLQERTVEEELYECLKLGYDLLSEDDWRLKDCFLYFAAFGEDFTIYFEQILWHWIGEGLVPGNGGDDPRADAFSLLNKLWRRSFIESNLEVSDEQGSVWFKLHDVMRDLAFYIVENDSGTPPAKELYLYRGGQNLEAFPQEWKPTLKQPSKARRLSLHRSNLKSLPGRFDAPELVSLLLGGNEIKFVPASFLSCFTKLRVLDLSGGKFQDLPEELGDLKDLVSLDLSDSNLETLPDAVGKLLMLKHLNLTGCQWLKYLPSGVVNLTSLQVLCMDACFSLTWAEHTPSGMARTESLGHVCPAVRASLEDICGLVALTDLRIPGIQYPVEELPHNISALTKLKILHFQLHVKTLPAEMPCWFKQLQQLEIWTALFKYLPRSFTCRGAFPALREFRLCGCVRLVEFPEVDEGALPKLQTLDFRVCVSLGTLPLSLEVLTSLRNLMLWECRETIQDSCRINCEKSSIWRRFHIRYH